MTHPPFIVETCKARIAEIDAWFDGASGWGSWMIALANEREALVNLILAETGEIVEHKHLARVGTGGRVS
jgi:hypothetical protein